MSGPAFAEWDIEELLGAVAERDRGAFAELYRRTAPKLYAVAARILGEQSKTEDAVQDVFVRIWRNAAGYDAGRGKPLTWLATIARNIAIDRHRAERSRGAGRADVDLDLLSHRDGKGASSEQLAALRACLGRLDGEQRRLVLAAYLDGASREELAARTTHPIGTIKSRLHRALGQLRSCLDG